MFVLGIDPGQRGAIAVLSDSRTGVIFGMPQTEKDICELLLDIKDKYSPIMCYIEDVHAMPKQGVSSTFKFGRNYGFLRGVLTALKIPFDGISPVTWQRKIRFSSKGNKKLAKQKAQNLFPSIEGITDLTADAVLIAYSCLLDVTKVRE